MLCLVYQLANAISPLFGTTVVLLESVGVVGALVYYGRKAEKPSSPPVALPPAATSSPEQSFSDTPRSI